ncbi:MAG TPA: rhodanese-like domain-containing protein, partial [Acidimicrobiales bacterium]
MTTSDLISQISTQELLTRLDADDQLFMIDVRDPDEVADWQIPGVHNIPLGNLEQAVGEVPRDRHLVIICAKGTRAQQGAQILANHGIESAVLEGGM